MMAMEGYVNPEPKESRIIVPVLDAAGIAAPLEMAIDTGFTGFMTLRPREIRAMGLERGQDRKMMLADGQVIDTLTWLATAIWHGKPTKIDVLELDARPVVGMSLLWGSDLAVQVRANGRVAITQQPAS